MKDLVVCVSGTFSPPHRGHIRMGIESAESLKKLGRKVRAVVFIPVHDNYLRNKVTSCPSIIGGAFDKSASSSKECFDAKFLTALHIVSQ